MKKIIIIFLLLPVFSFAGMTDKHKSVIAQMRVSEGGETLCIGYSNEDTSCIASLNAGSQYVMGSDLTVLRKWTADTDGTVSKISIGINGTPAGTSFAAVFYIGTTLTAYKVFTPSTGENEIDMSTGATGTLTFSTSDDVYYGVSVDDPTTGGLERDDSVSQPPANYFAQIGAYLPDPITYTETTNREFAARLEYVTQ